MAIEWLESNTGGAWFWTLVGADFLLVVSTLFSIFYLMRVALTAVLPRRRNLERWLPGVATLFLLSVALSCTHCSRFVAGLWKGCADALLGSYVEAWFPHTPVQIWLAGTLVALGMLGAQHVALMNLLRRLPGFDDPAFAEAVARVGLRRPVDVKNCGDRSSACSWGVMRPCVLVPEDFASRFTYEERRCIYIHELVHLRQFDPVKYLAISLVRALLWFNPVVRLALRSILGRIEIACDKATVSLCLIKPARYAGLILKAHSAGQEGVPGFSYGSGELRLRLGHILQEPSLLVPRSRTARHAALSLVVLAGISLAMRQHIGAEWRLADPVRQPTSHDGTETHGPGLEFYWNGALGTYMQLTPPKNNPLY